MKKEKDLIKHYHCPECGDTLKEIGRIGWSQSNEGVVIIYQCVKHIFVWTENSNKIKKIYD